MTGKAGKKAPKKKGANGYKLPDPIPNGEILTDLMKRQWIIGNSIGVGGFGEIYAGTLNVLWLLSFFLLFFVVRTKKVYLTVSFYFPLEWVYFCDKSLKEGLFNNFFYFSVCLFS